MTLILTHCCCEVIQRLIGTGIHVNTSPEPLQNRKKPCTLSWSPLTCKIQKPKAKEPREPKKLKTKE